MMHAALLLASLVAAPGSGGTGSGARAHWHELRDGLANSRHALSSGPGARVAFLGGSITFNPGWRDEVCAELTRRFPETELAFVNAGIPSMGSTPGAFRLADDVLDEGPVDLLFVEAAVNDESNGRSAAEMLRGMEGIVRHARRANPAMDLVMMHFVDPRKMAAMRAGEVPEVVAVHERVAEHYGVPSLDLAREVTERIDAGEFTWEDDFRNLHPSPFGQALYVRSILALLDAAWAEPSVSGPRAHTLPPALDDHSYDAGALVPVARAHALEGFTRVASWRPADDAGTRRGFVDVPMLVAGEPGASLAFVFEGRGVGILVAAGPDAGTIAFEVDGGPTGRVDLFTRWSSGLHLPWAYVLTADLAPGRHELRVRVLEQRNDASRGHAVRIARFLVNGPAR